MALERTFSIIKPDATKRNLTGAIVAKFEAAGLRGIGGRGYSGGREELHQDRFVRVAGGCARVRSERAFALSGQGDENDGDASDGRHEGIVVDQGLGFLVAGTIQLQGLRRSARGDSN